MVCEKNLKTKTSSYSTQEDVGIPPLHEECTDVIISWLNKAKMHM